MLPRTSLWCWRATPHRPYAPAIGGMQDLVGRAIREVTAEREARGVTTVAIPRTGRPSAARREVERARGFRNLVKWRTGAEGRISRLKHGGGWDRTLLDGLGGRRPGH